MIKAVLNNAITKSAIDLLTIMLDFITPLLGENIIVKVANSKKHKLKIRCSDHPILSSIPPHEHGILSLKSNMIAMYEENKVIKLKVAYSAYNLVNENNSATAIHNSSIGTAYDKTLADELISDDCPSWA